MLCKKERRAEGKGVRRKAGIQLSSQECWAHTINAINLNYILYLQSVFL